MKMRAGLIGKEVDEDGKKKVGEEKKREESE